MNSPTPSQPKRILYWAGPAEIYHLYTCWSQQQADPSYFGCSYLEQFFGVCQAHNYKFHLISTLSKPQQFYHQDDHIFEFRSNLSRGKTGLRFHLLEVFNILGIAATAVQGRFDLLVISQGRPYWFLLLPLRLLGLKIIPSIHCVLWRKFGKRKKNIYYYLYGLTRYFFRWGCSGIMAVSQDIANQIRVLTRNPNQDIRVFIPNYPPDLFGQFARADWAKRPLRVIFVGRIETNKGVYLIPALAQRLCAEEQRQIHFDVCGDGSQLEMLRQTIESQNLNPWVTVHGYCDLQTLSRLYSESHVVFVPTQSDFIEGFNKVVAEGVLANRPVVASRVCPAVDMLEEAVIAIDPDDLEGYYEAIVRLYEDEAFYRQKQQACVGLQQLFYDLDRGWGKTFQTLLQELNF